jgi:hypothetical protein
MKVLAIASAAMLVSIAASADANAQVAYTNSALKGCYAHLSTSVDTGSAAENRDIVGTICFDGKGNIVTSSSAPYLTGAVSNTNGDVHRNNDINGTYNVTNAPGDGMGEFDGKCAKHAFVLKHVDSDGLAHGFSYILVKHKTPCKKSDIMVIGGNAEYQGPLK